MKPHEKNCLKQISLGSRWIALVLIMIGYGGIARADLVATMIVKTKPLPNRRTKYIYTISNKAISTVNVDGMSFTANQGENLQVESMPDGWIAHGHNVDQPVEQLIFDAPEAKHIIKPGKTAVFVFSADNGKVSRIYSITGKDVNNNKSQTGGKIPD